MQFLNYASQESLFDSSPKEMNTDFLMIRDDDIPGFVDSDASDIGIVGENSYFRPFWKIPEHNLTVIAKLGFLRNVV